LFVADGVSNDTPAPFHNLGPGPSGGFGGPYWSVTEFSTDTTYAFYFVFNAGFIGTANKIDPYYAWPVRPGDIGTVPIPGAILFPSALSWFCLKRRAGRLAGFRPTQAGRNGV
jgi:hypothetical protein